MNDDPKKPAGDSQSAISGDQSPEDAAPPQHTGPRPSTGADAADLPGDEGLRALYAQLPDVAPRAELDEAILAASRETLRGATGRRVESRRDRSSRRSAVERATRVLRWGLPVAAAAGVMFAVLREHGDLVPRADLAASPSVSGEQASRPNREQAGRISEPPSAPAEHAERDDSASLRFAPPAPPPAAEMQEKAAPPSAEARSAAREAFDSSAAVRGGRATAEESSSTNGGRARAEKSSPTNGGRAIADAPAPANDGRGIPVPPPAASAAPAIPAPSAAESAGLSTAAPPARTNEPRSAPAAAMPKSKDHSSTASAIVALAAKESAAPFSITEADKPWPFGLEYAMSTETACAKLRPLSSRGCVLHNGAAVVEFDEPRRLSSGLHEGRWIVAVKMIAKNGVITKLDLTERQERKE